MDTTIIVGWEEVLLVYAPKQTFRFLLTKWVNVKNGAAAISQIIAARAA